MSYFLYSFCKYTPPGQNKWTKILGLEITIFGIKIMVKNGLEKNYFKIPRAPSEIPPNEPGQFSPSVQIFLHWAAATLKGHMEFQNDFF